MATKAKDKGIFFVLLLGTKLGSIKRRCATRTRTTQTQGLYLELAEQPHLSFHLYQLNAEL